MTKNLSDELQWTTRQALAGLQPSRQGDEPGGLPFRRLLSAVFRARYLVLATTLVGILIGSFMAVTTANTYVSTGKFRFTGSGAESRDLDPTRATQTSQETIGTTATYILTTDGLLRRVVEKVGAARILAPYRPDNPDASALKAFFYRIQRDWNATSDADMTDEEALKRLQRSIAVERPRYTDVLVAQCTANDPKLAQEILSVYLREAIEYHVQTYADANAYEAAQKAVEAARAASATAHSRFAEFLHKHQIDDFEDRKKRLQAEEADTAERVAHLASEVNEFKTTDAELTKLLEGENAISRYTKDKRKLDLSSALAELGKKKAQLELELATMKGGGFATSSQDLKAKEREIQAVDDAMVKMFAESADAPMVEVTVENPHYAATLAERDKARTQLEIKKINATFAIELDRAAKKSLRDLLALEPEYQKLAEAVTLCEDTLKSAEATWYQAQQKKELTQGHFSALKEIEPASMPLEKEGPSRGKLMIGATLVGLFLGLGLVILIALPDTIVRTRDDLEDIEGLAVIGVLPRLETTNLKRHVHRRRRGW
ncbi:MAG: hypothetical protein U1E73_04675 [Planctomycetota bacterium]